MKSQLAIYSDQKASAAPVRLVEGEAAIADALQEIGVAYECWSADQPLAADASHAEIKAAYARDIERLSSEQGFTTVDVVAMHPEHPQKAEFRQKFLAEHRHSEHEVRFFVAGSGLFFMHLHGLVFRLLCTKGDLVSVPAKLPHWFDMGDKPNFTAIRLFTDPEGWVADFTGDDIANHYPLYGAAEGLVA